MCFYIKYNELKGLCNKYEEEHNTTYQEWQKDIQANKKAIEYIKENACWDTICHDDLCYDECDVLLNILQGEDNW